MADYKEEEEIKVPRFEEKHGFYTTKKRSHIMSKIRGKDTKPEVALRKELWRQNIRYRKDYAKLPGKPDIVSKKYRFVVFVDGEFWHGRNWEEKKEKIKSNRAFWIPKIERNMQRDRQNNQKLADLGYTVFRFWDTEIKKNPEQCVALILEHVNK